MSKVSKRTVRVSTCSKTRKAIRILLRPTFEKCLHHLLLLLLLVVILLFILRFGPLSLDVTPCSLHCVLSWQCIAACSSRQPCADHVYLTTRSASHSICAENHTVKKSHSLNTHCVHRRHRECSNRGSIKSHLQMIGTLQHGKQSHASFGAIAHNHFIPKETGKPIHTKRNMAQPNATHVSHGALRRQKITDLLIGKPEILSQSLTPITHLAATHLIL